VVFEKADQDVFKGTIPATAGTHMKRQARWQIHLLGISLLHYDSGSYIILWNQLTVKISLSAEYCNLLKV